jgi:hypothetical protein
LFHSFQTLYRTPLTFYLQCFPLMERIATGQGRPRPAVCMLRSLLLMTLLKDPRRQPNRFTKPADKLLAEAGQLREEDFQKIL